MKDKAGGGGRCTTFLGVCLGMGIAVGTSSFAVDWCWIRHQTSCLVGGQLGWGGIWLGKRGRGRGEQEMSEENLAGILYKLGLAAYAAAALLAWAARSGHSLDHAVCMPLHLQQE